MCGRLNIIDDPLTQLLMEITGQSTDWSLTTEYNVAPTQQVPVLRYAGDDNSHGVWNLADMRWWLVPSWSPGPSTKYSMFNAKAETLGQSRAYQKPYHQQRCVVPASGYYEWKKEGTQKLPFYIEPAEQSGFAFAALWDRWQRDGQVIESCTIVTTAATAAMSGIHHRMPVQLTSEQALHWVSADTPLDVLENLLAPELRTTVRVTPVSQYVNNARNKDERCIEPLADAFLIH